MTLPLSGNALSLEVLLEPIAPEQPCGPSLRYDPDYDRLRELRREDDSSLPTGVWQAEAKRADWAAVEQLASELLQRRSKDLMLAAWLGEAWLQRGGLGGLQRALVLLAELCERYPEEVHPQAQDGDQSAGAAHRLAVAPLCRAAAHAPAADGAGRLRRDHPLCLAEVAAPAGRQRRQQERQGGAGSGATSAEEARRSVARGAPGAMAAQAGQPARLPAATATPGTVVRPLPGRTRPQLPAAARGHRAMAGLAQGVHRHAPAAPLPEEQPPVAEADAAEGDADGEESVPASAPSGPAGAPTSREDAYRQLLLIADYLARTEPHSPVPYLIKRAVEWGNKPLSELLAELINADSEARRVWSLLGVLP
ncbi:type VI secretion system protein TssA [Pseudomonas aeruginosa]|nr:type VI secretion system protein TssA [Pseudomonas aeruginosa]